MNRLVALALCFLLVACGENEPPKKTPETNMDEDKALLKDVARAGPELEHRLLESIQAQNGIVTVRDQVKPVTLYFLPTTTPWVLQCGNGISIVFGSSVSGNPADNDVDINLTYKNP